MPELKLRKTGNSLSTSWPKEALARMNAKEGDTLYAIETPQGFLVTPFDPKFAATMETADRVFRRYRNAYRELSDFTHFGPVGVASPMSILSEEDRKVGWTDRPQG